MAEDESTPLLNGNNDRRRSTLTPYSEDVRAIIKSHVNVEEQKLVESNIGEFLPYNDYTTIDFLHDLVRSKQ